MEAGTASKWIAFIILVVIIIGIAIGGLQAAEPQIEAAGTELPDWTKDFFRVIFGGGLPNEMFYTYTIVPYLLLPFAGAFIIIYFLVEKIAAMPPKFSAPLAIVVVLIACASGIFVKMVFALLFAFGFYGFLLVWVVLILSASIWGVGTIGERAGKLSGIMKKYEKKTLGVLHELEKAQADYDKYDRIVKNHPRTPQAKIALKKRTEVSLLLVRLSNELDKLKEKEAKKEMGVD